jgi:hypothetical protein
MIATLTTEQVALQTVVRDEWITFCLGGDISVNKEETIKGIEWIYSLKKMDRPKFIEFAEGPLAAQYMANIFPSVLKEIKIKAASVRASVGASVRASVRASVWDSVWASVRDSVWDSVWAYQGSLFNIWGTEYKFQPAVDLWKRGFVASFDGTTWRLHSGKKAEIVWEGKF